MIEDTQTQILISEMQKMLSNNKNQLTPTQLDGYTTLNNVPVMHQPINNPVKLYDESQPKNDTDIVMVILLSYAEQNGIDTKLINSILNKYQNIKTEQLRSFYHNDTNIQFIIESDLILQAVTSHRYFQLPKTKLRQTLQTKKDKNTLNRIHKDLTVIFPENVQIQNWLFHKRIERSTPIEESVHESLVKAQWAKLLLKEIYAVKYRYYIDNLQHMHRESNIIWNDLVILNDLENFVQEFVAIEYTVKISEMVDLLYPHRNDLTYMALINLMLLSQIYNREWITKMFE